MKARFLLFLFLLIGYMIDPVQAQEVYGGNPPIVSPYTPETVPTVTSDKEDYAPGEVAIITGQGWIHDSVVDLHFIEDPFVDHIHDYHDIVVNEDGTFRVEFPILERHLGVKFTLHAEGTTTGQVALAYFTDANVRFSTSGLPSGVNVTVSYSGTAPGPTAVNTTVTFSTSGSGSSGNIPLIGNLTFSFPASITVGANVYVLSSTNPTSPASVPTTGNFPIVGTYVLQSGGQGSIASISIGSQSSTVVYGSSSTTVYNVTSLRASNGTVNGTYSVSGLPAGVTSGGFSPSATFNSTGGNAFPGATLTLNVPANLGAGSYNFNVLLTDGTNQATTQGTLTVNKAATVTVVTINGGLLTYTGSAQTPATVTVTGAGGLNLSPIANYSNNINAGTATASYAYAETANYLASSDSETFEIAKADALVTVNGYTGVYDALPHGATGSVTGVAGDPTAAGSSLDLGASFTDVPGGTANWTFEGGTNYEDESGSVAITITKADALVTVNGYTGVYDALPHGATGTATGVAGVDLSAGLDFGDSFTNVPGGTANWTFDGGINYEDESGSVAITITKASITVVNTNRSKVYGVTLTDADYTGSITGVVAGDNITVTRASAGDAAGATVAGSPYAIIGTLVDPDGRLDNYNVSNPNGVLTVTKASITVVNTNRSKVYGVTLTNTDYAGSITGVVAGDNITVTRASAGDAANATVAGSPYAIIGTLVDPDGRLDNYNVSNPNGVLTVTKASITVVNTNRSKVFVATLTNADYTGSITGVVAGDNITVTRASTGDPAGALVGPYPIVGTLVDPDNRLPNYNVSNPNGVLTVIKDQTTLVYSGDVSEQYSDVTELKATLTANLFGAGIAGRTIKFTIGTQSVTGVTNTIGVANATLKLTQSPTATYNVVTEFVSDAFYESSSDSDVFDITQENAVVEYTGSEFVGVNSATATTTPVLLTASINDIADGVGLEGDIRNARVQFYDINTNAAISGWLTPGLVTPGDFTKGIVNHSWNASVPSTGYNSTTVGIRVGTQSPEGNGFYIGSGQTVINVYRVSLVEFITGGGHIIPTDSRGEFASDVSKKVNFGYNVKWNKSVKNLQGNFNLIFRRGGKVYQIRSTALNSLSIVSTNPCSQKATFTTKATLTDVTNPILPISIYGGITLEVTMTDNGEPGRTDMIGITLLNGNNLVFSSSWPVNKTLESHLAGGNLVVHNGVKCTVTGTTTTAITSTKNPSNPGNAVTFRATVTGAVTIPTGTITFKNGTSVLGVVTMVGGTASFTTSTLPLGDHQITALYSGDSRFLSSLGSLTQKVVSLTARVIDGQESNDLITVTWNTPVETIKKKVDQMAAGWFEGRKLEIILDASAYDQLTPGFYELKVNLEENNFFTLDEPIAVRVLVQNKPQALDITISNDRLAGETKSGQVIGTLSTIDAADNIHTYQIEEPGDITLEGNNVIWRGTSIPAQLTFKVFSTDRAGQTISREITLMRDLAPNTIMVYPNPASEASNIQVNLVQASEVTLRVFDAAGRLVMEEQSYQERSFVRPLDLKGLSNGLYHIVVQVGNQVMTKRLVKQ